MPFVSALLTNSHPITLPYSAKKVSQQNRICNHLFIPSLFSTAQANETVRVYSPLNTGWFPRSASTFPHETSLAGSHAPLAIGMGSAPLPAKAPQIGGSQTPLDGKK